MIVYVKVQGYFLPAYLDINTSKNRGVTSFIASLDEALISRLWWPQMSGYLAIIINTAYRRCAASSLRLSSFSR